MQNTSVSNSRNEWNDFTKELKRLVDKNGTYNVKLRDGRVLPVEWFIDPGEWSGREHQHFRHKDETKNWHLIWENCGRSVTSRDFDIVSFVSKRTPKVTIRVFPDYCSTGIWSLTANIGPESIGIKDHAILMALKYWHWTWEFLITEGKLSMSAGKGWIADGQKLVDQLNKEYGKKYKFVYNVDESDLATGDWVENPPNLEIPNEDGWTCKHPNYGEWFISKDAVIQDWKRDHLEAYPNEKRREPSEEEVETWFNEQTSWVEVAQYGVQLVRPDMQMFESSLREEMKNNTDYLERTKIHLKK